MAKTKGITSARNYIWRLFRFRPRSESEIRERLKAKEYDSQIIEPVIASLKESGYINDAAFARAWIESRLNKPLGFRVIRLELTEKGISPAIIEELLGEKKESFDEAGIVKAIAGKYLERPKARNEPADKIKPKLYAYLIRRGFSPDVVRDTIIKIIKNRA